ncbi:TFIIH subunit Tfb4/p34, partial [Chytridium lagenaria]
MEHVIMMINAYLSLHFENKLAVILCSFDKSEMIYSTDGGCVSTGTPRGDKPTKKSGNIYKQFREVDDVIMDHLKSLDFELSDSVNGSSLVAGAISQALSYINRLRKSTEGASNLESRVLLMSVSSDGSTQYIPMMNCIFAAQKYNIKVDVCKVYGKPSVFLPQAAHITGGTFLEVKEPRNLITYLWHSFLPEPSVRPLFYSPSDQQVDYRSTCFCHRNIIDVGFVCSVCLSIFCKQETVCPMCRSSM